MVNKIKKRFVAGAVCPKCKAQDSIMLYFENNVEKIECVHCDYHESQVDKKVGSASKGSTGVIGVFKPE
ncbi:MAG: YheV family putative metal-binding protein [Paraglaciecola sp.]|uniref:YheV family putative zinc ribbon protein n=1 Tax=Paraglaciecola sp. TaxID=1920173 RepID=UPI00273F6E71|nr:YheV family putative zinc ribbon protein [Paraglaciecola sp.]MDP5032166.1 YheV family putative metal-binding protein [Paraglaciecola sp.]MDP5132913.1 YheV family putative metal-binding protein [Paraglaciecola sp.]